MAAPRSSLPVRLARFVLERYSPLAYGPLILALVLAGEAGAALAASRGLALTWLTAVAAACAALGFLQLRVLDELADAEVDRVGRPDRPLPRGLVSAAELRALAIVAAGAGLALAVALGTAGVACYALALAQVWILAAGPARQALARHGPVVDALGHSLIVPTMLAVGWSSGGSLQASPGLGWLLLLAWGAGLALELSRKIVRAREERPAVQTYSGALGRSRALALLAIVLVAMAAGASLVAATAGVVAWLVVLPIALVGAVLVATLALAGRLPTHAVRGAVPVLVLGALIWPSLLAWGLR